MIEIEAKIRILSPESYREIIKKFSKYKGKENKIDYYYTLEDLKNYPKKSLRLRQKKGSYEVNIKKRISYDKGIHVKEEVEFNVKDAKIFENFIKNLGFKLWLKKEKESEIYEISKNFCIEINKVKCLGWFIEIEYLCERNGISLAKKKVLDILKKFGVKEKDIVKEGYTKMLWDKGLCY